MATVHRIGSLEIPQDLEFTRRSWTFERIGWVGLALVLVAGILGLLGSGLFSAATAGEIGDPLRVRFERFGHFESDGQLTVEFRPRVRDGLAELWIEDTYLNRVEIRDILPRPVRTELRQDRKVYFFPIDEGSDTVQVRIDLTYKKAGRIVGKIGTADAPAVEIRQFIYP
jgi:hypothetical protein